MMKRDRTTLTIEDRRNIFLTAVQIEEASIMANRRSGDNTPHTYNEARLNWKDWQIEFFGCIPDGARNVLTCHYARPLSETRAPKGNQLTQHIRQVWREARRKKLLWQGLHISKMI
jgi:hypothetical protein